VFSKAQDTITVYFEFGSSIIPKEEKLMLAEIRNKYQLNQLDSAHFVGTADSVGSVSANFKLSEKRARNVANYFEDIFPQNTLIRTFARGEKQNKKSLNYNRKVEVILFFKNIENETENKSDNVKADSLITVNYCHHIAYDILHRSTIREIKYRRKSYVQIETFPNLIKKELVYYSASKNSKGKLVYNKIKWSNGFANVPKKDFDSYKIFTRSIGPCIDTCNENLIEDHLLKSEKCIQLDTILMKRLEYKAILFNFHFYKVRTFKENVNLSDKYYYGCNRYPLQWKTKKYFKRKNYYYAKLPRTFFCGDNILREMDCCKYSIEPDRCDACVLPFLKCMRGFGLTLDINPGYNHFINRHEKYIGIQSTLYSNFHEIILGLNFESKGHFYSTFTYNFDLLQFPYDAINPFGGWKKGMNSNFGRIYVGTELRSLSGKNNSNYLDQNIHVGFAHWSTNIIGLRFFAQYGLAYDYLHHNTNSCYSLFEMGIQFNVLPFYLR
jgi:hypothetical protein